MSEIAFAGGPMDGQSLPGPPEEGGGAVKDPVEALRILVDGLKAYLEIEPDDEDKNQAAQCLAKLQALLAKNQKQEETALGVSPAAKYVARQGARQGY